MIDDMDLPNRLTKADRDYLEQYYRPCDVPNKALSYVTELEGYIRSSLDGMYVPEESAVSNETILREALAEIAANRWDRAIVENVFYRLSLQGIRF